MTVIVETATVYRGGGRRWFSLRAACNAEAGAIMRTKDKPRCECQEAEYENGFMYSPSDTCVLHEHDRYTKRKRRLARLIERAALTTGAEKP